MAHARCVRQQGGSHRDDVLSGNKNTSESAYASKREASPATTLYRKEISDTHP